MTQKTSPLPQGAGSASTIFWPAVTGSFLLLAAIGALDWFTGWEFSFTLIYLIPICTATWFGGRRIGTVFSFVAVTIGLVMWLSARPGVTTGLWNAGMKFGVFSVFCFLLDHVRQHQPEWPTMRTIYQLLGLGALSAGLLGLAGLVIEWVMVPGPSQPKPQTVSASVVSRTAAPTDSAVGTGLLSEIAGDIRNCMRSSRPVLLGSRDPMGPSCVTPIKSGQLKDTAPANPGDWNGGPGTTMAMLYYFDRQNLTSPTQDYTWHQNRLRKYLENESVSNAESAQLSAALSEKTMGFFEAAQDWSAFPQGLKPAGFNEGDDWPSYCMAELDKAVAARNLDDVKRWSAELASATFALADLHRWLGFLVDNQLTALDFQKKCQPLFAAADALNPKYDPQSTISQFPAGVLSLNGLGNYYEIERQAERVFSMPADRLQELADNAHWTDGSVWVMPARRECFLKLEQVLSPANRNTLRQAARTPYEHSYLVNMLYRAWQSDMADELCQSMHRFDSNNPNAKMQELLSALMYRGHSFAGLEWADRYTPELMDAAAKIRGTDAEALMQACAWTSSFYRSHTDYGVTLTLRDALASKRLDCVRATDMIGAIFRNAGHGRFGHVRWCAENGGHSVAAYMGRTADDQSKILLADGLSPNQKEPEVWPSAYFHGHAWPPGFDDKAQPYAMELYGRGIDGYIWLEGYIVRGPNAGILTQAAVPYSQHRTQTSTRKVFDGPYPQ